MKTHMENAFSFRTDNIEALVEPQECVPMHMIPESQTALLLPVATQELGLSFCFTFLTRLCFEALRQEVMWGQNSIHKDFKDVSVPHLTYVSIYHALYAVQSFMHIASSLTLKMFSWLYIKMRGYIHTYKYFLV